ncbi:GLUG motif-containing protein [Methanolapillus ohkumae]|uniref:GLUG domain-containing protein n=1 Tax=Methanolapillus ohkumae TaxID=3028298 RepID=A0AA96V7U7_9EURY|nr:hypothetical protein MsAm2_15900 [Methanosarcinaceae archaeon Am2]
MIKHLSINSVPSLMIILFIFVLCCNPVYAFSGDGNGTSENPFQITTIEQLDEIRNNLSASYILMNDLDFSDSDVWEPIGSFQEEKNFFSGQLNGNGKIIQNLSISSSKSQSSGLFGYIDQGGEVKNLGLVNPSFSGDSGVGSLVGRNYGSIQNCSAVHVKGNSNNDLGGLVGCNFGSIAGCFATGELFGENTIGGLVGANYGFINCSYAACSIEGKGYEAGGFVGNNFQGKIQNCYSNSAVIGESVVGGFAGQNYEGFIEGCYATGTVFAWQDYAGGMAGKNRGVLKDSWVLTKSVNVGSTYFESGNKKSIGRVAGINEYFYNTGSIYWANPWDGMTTNTKFRKEDPKTEYSTTVRSEDIWGNPDNWGNFGSYFWALKDFENYQLPVFDWQTESPGDASYLNPENSAEKSKSIPGFELIFGILALAGVAFVYRKMKW